MSNQKALDLGHRVRKLLVDNDRSLAWLSRNISVSYNTLLKRMQDPGDFTQHELGEIAAAFNVEVEWLQTGIRIEDAA